MDIELEHLDEIYLHNGRFSADDVIAVSLLKLVNPNIRITRLNYGTNLDEDKVSLGLQVRNDLDKDKDVKFYSLSKCVFDLLSEAIFKKFEFVNFKEAYEMMINNYLKRLSKESNSSTSEMALLEAYNLCVYEDRSEEHINLQFNEAVRFGTVIVKEWIRYIYGAVEMIDDEEQIWNDAVDHSEEGIFVLKKNIPWRKRCKDYNVNFVIFKSNRGGYNIVANELNQVKLKKDELLSFIHPSGNIGAARTLENAIQAAKDSLS